MARGSGKLKNVLGITSYNMYSLFKRIWVQLSIITLMFLAGMAIFMYYENLDWLSALLVSVSTITTIGMWVPKLDTMPAMEKVLLIIVIISAVGSAASLLQSMIANLTALLVEGELTESFRRKRMEKIAKGSENHYIICGIGSVGINIVNELYATKRPHIIVELDEEKLKKSLEQLRDEIFIIGDATDSNVLEKAGAKSAKGLFAVTGEDHKNLVISLTARQLNPTMRIIARCNDTRNTEKLRKVGADAIVSPGYVGGLRMASEMVRPTTVTFLDTMLRDRERNLRVEEVSVPALFIGKQIVNLNLKQFQHTMLLAIKAGEGWIYNPRNDHVIAPGNTLIVVTTPEERIELEKWSQVEK